MNRISQDQFQNAQTVIVLSYDLGHAPVHMEEVIASVSWREKLLQCSSGFKQNAYEATLIITQGQRAKHAENETSSIPSNKSCLQDL